MKEVNALELQKQKLERKTEQRLKEMEARHQKELDEKAKDVKYW